MFDPYLNTLFGFLLLLKCFVFKSLLRTSRHNLAVGKTQLKNSLINCRRVKSFVLDRSAQDSTSNFSTRKVFSSLELSHVGIPFLSCSSPVRQRQPVGFFPSDSHAFPRRRGWVGQVGGFGCWRALPPAWEKLETEERLTSWADSAQREGGSARPR